jgi:hypothetical protein
MAAGTVGGNGTTVAGNTSGTGTAQIASVVQQNAEFQGAMRKADEINTQQSMLTSLTLNGNQNQRKSLESSTEAQNQDNGRRPQAVGGLYRNA